MLCSAKRLYSNCASISASQLDRLKLSDYSMSLLRKKKSTFDESDLPTDNWIWGNSRGGGGAPLKDNNGNDVANLKKVFTGVVEVDHSPSPNAKLKHMQQNRRGGYDEDIGLNQNSNGNVRNNKNNRGNSNRDYEQEEDDYSRDRRDGGRINRQTQEEAVPKNFKKSFNHYSDGARDDQRFIPGLTDLRENPNNPNSPRHVQKVHNYNGVASPPKKYLGAIKEMNQSHDMSERDAKIRKQMEYQEMLKQQIEEKQRKKDQEKAEQDAIKRRELAEFLATQAKKGIVNPNTVLDKPPTHPGNNNANNNNNGKRPPRFRADSADGAELDDHGGYNNNNNYNNGRGRSSTYSDSEEDYSRNSRAPAKLSLPPGAGGGRGGGRVGGGGAGGSWDDQDDERDGRGGRSQAYPNRGGGAGGGRGGGGRGGGGHNEDDSDRDYPSDGSNDGRHGGGRGGVRGGGRGGGGGARGNAGGRNTADSAGAEDDDYVPKEEYDELSKLCDKLLTQQEQLQLEVRKQADMLKALKGRAGSGSSAVSGLPPRGSASVTKPPAKGAAALGLPSSPSKLISRSKSAVSSRDRSGVGQGVEESKVRAASNLRPRANKETEKERRDRERAERQRLKEFEPIKQSKQVDGKSRYGAAGAFGGKARPSSMNAAGGGHDEGEGGRRPVPKVAFGSNKELDKNNAGAGGAKNSKFSQQGANVIGAGGKNAARGNNSKSNFREEGGGGGGGVNGFAKLQLSNSRVSGGPAVVVHEEDVRPTYVNHNANTPSPVRRGEGGGGGRMQNNDRGRASMGELRGQSEYIPISGNNDDMMGGDQLEKLLYQSRNARY